MDVQLYVYDLSQGLARQMSLGFLGTHIDAVYHTSLVLGNVEYFFGAGVQTCYPGATHHGQPMEKIAMGRTELDLETIMEYLESLKAVYTHESYDLFMHNCNNFTNDFAMFLVGKGIPGHITSLPQTVLNTPFGQMLKPQLDRAMRGITQVPSAPSAAPPQRQAVQPARAPALPNGHAPRIQPAKQGVVHNVTMRSELSSLLSAARSSCAVIFFTSSTCAPCKICYGPYDSLAAEAGPKATLIKVDISFAHDIASTYSVRATPTFMTFLKGDKLEQWSGADPGKLQGNVRLLVQMTHPPHPHSQMRLPTLQRTYEKPTIYSIIPPVEKVVKKLGAVAEVEEVKTLIGFVEGKADEKTAANVPLPDLTKIGNFVRKEVGSMEKGVVFALVDLLRVAMGDPRASGFFAEETASPSTPQSVFNVVINDTADCSMALKLVTLQLACNLFSSPLFISMVVGNGSLCQTLVQLSTQLMLDESKASVRQAAVSLGLNMIAISHRKRFEEEADPMPEAVQVELGAGILEAISHEEDPGCLDRMLLALGLLCYSCRQDGELKELLAAMDAAGAIQNKAQWMRTQKRPDSVAQEVLKVVS